MIAHSGQATADGPVGSSWVTVILDSGDNSTAPPSMRRLIVVRLAEGTAGHVGMYGD